jgi:hypothetical protein
LEAIEANSSLLGIMNMLPGKNGQRWVVLPLNLESGGVEYAVSLRILLRGEEASRCRAERVVLAAEGRAKEGGLSDGCRWLFTLTGGGEQESCLDVLRNPPAADPAGLKKELEGLLGAYAGRIQVGALPDDGFLPGEYGSFAGMDGEVYY